MEGLSQQMTQPAAQVPVSDPRDDLADRLASLSRTLTAMSAHEQGHHGWSGLYEALRSLIGQDAPSLARVLTAAWSSRPHMSDSHLVTMISILIRDLTRGRSARHDEFQFDEIPAWEAQALHGLINEHEADLVRALGRRSNSFTGARRFLVPQIMLGAYAQAARLPEVRLADLGTGIGLMPRQLNNPSIFERFSEQLRWFPGAPGYLDIPLASRHGVDKHPLPTIDWVRACHGPSQYYDERFGEVVWSLEQCEASGAQIRLDALDISNAAELRAYLSDHHFNVVTCSFVLYQYSDEVRDRVVSTVAACLPAPGLFLSMEPASELSRMGARVHGYLAGASRPLDLAHVSDAHFIGSVARGTDIKAVMHRWLGDTN